MHSRRKAARENYSEQTCLIDEADENQVDAHRIYGAARHQNKGYWRIGQPMRATISRTSTYLPFFTHHFHSARQLTINSFLKSAGTPD